PVPRWCRSLFSGSSDCATLRRCAKHAPGWRRPCAASRLDLRAPLALRSRTYGACYPPAAKRSLAPTSADENQSEFREIHPDLRRQKPRRAVAAWDVRKPIIAAINGADVGVGATLPMQWDIRIAAESARIGFVFVRRGVVPEALSTWTLPRLVGMARAAELLLTGRILSAREALEWGLVSRVVPDAELVPTARALAAEIARETAPVSVAI